MHNNFIFEKNHIDAELHFWFKGGREDEEGFMLYRKWIHMTVSDYQQQHNKT